MYTYITKQSWWPVCADMNHRRTKDLRTEAGFCSIPESIMTLWCADNIDVTTKNKCQPFRHAVFANFSIIHQNRLWSNLQIPHSRTTFASQISTGLSIARQVVLPPVVDIASVSTCIDLPSPHATAPHHTPHPSTRVTPWTHPACIWSLEARLNDSLWNYANERGLCFGVVMGTCFANALLHLRVSGAGECPGCMFISE